MLNQPATSTTDDIKQIPTNNNNSNDNDLIILLKKHLNNLPDTNKLKDYTSLIVSYFIDNNINKDSIISIHNKQFAEKLNDHLKNKKLTNPLCELHKSLIKSLNPQIASSPPSSPSLLSLKSINQVLFKSNKNNKDNNNNTEEIILIKECDMIAPMTRIKGHFKLTTCKIYFIPYPSQVKLADNLHEINLAKNPPPLPISSSSLKTNDNSDNNGNDNDTTYWIATNVCSTSYQQIGGTRYRLMRANRYWNIGELKEIYYRRYQLINCGLELFFTDDTSFLFNFHNKNKRNKVFNDIMSLSPPNLIESREFFENPRKAINTSKIHYKWCRREITNFEYLMKLNTLSGRTFNDLTQYPILPWVIIDFKSDKLNLNNKKIYRDLSKPIGALNPVRLKKFVNRYKSLCDDLQLCQDDDEKSKIHCFMYGTHYSSVGICLYYLIRMQPFTTYNLKFQDGKFDIADRLFYSIYDTFNGCLNSTTDVKELLPEFYYLPDFLVNKQNLDLGARQNKMKVDNVVLPPWANNSAERFIKIMRDALESEYVSSNLHHWIDLVFGFKQRGRPAIKAYNLFHPYTYSGTIDIETITDLTERKAILAQIDQYGQTPLQLFNKKHEQRLKEKELLTNIFKTNKIQYYDKYHLTSTHDIGIISILWRDKSIIVIDTNYCIDIHKWKKERLTIEKSKENSFTKIINIGLRRKKQNKIGADKKLTFFPYINQKDLCFAMTQNGFYLFVCGLTNYSFIVWDVVNSKTIQIILKHNDIVSCLAIDQDSSKHKTVLVTGSFDKRVIVWRVNSDNINNDNIHVIDPTPIHILENQLAPIQCVDISLKSGIIVCCSQDGIINVYNSSTGEHHYLLQPYVDRMKHIRQKNKNMDNDNDNDNDQKSNNNNNSGIKSGELTIVRVSNLFGHIISYSKQTKDIFLYSSDQLVSYAVSGDDVYNNILFSQYSHYIVCGGKNGIIRIKELPSFKTVKKYKDPRKQIKYICLNKNQTSMLIGLVDGDVMVYSLEQKVINGHKQQIITELGF